jgi:hypothetical protein
MDQFVLICPENWKFQQHPLTSRDHFSWTICRIRVCKYLLEMYHSYLQLLCSTLLLNLHHLRSASVLAIITHSGQILSKSVKLNEFFLPL